MGAAARAAATLSMGAAACAADANLGGLLVWARIEVGNEVGNEQRMKVKATS